MITDNYTVLTIDKKVVGEIKPGEVKATDLIQGATVGSFMRIKNGNTVIEYNAGDIIPIKETPRRKRKAPIKQQTEDTIEE